MKPTTIILITLLLLAGIGSAFAAPAPSCDFTASTTSGPEDLTVTFTATFEGISPPVTYEWDFGDDSGADKLSGATVTHTYRNPGKYTVSLIVNDLGVPTTWWVRNTKTDYISVTNLPPVANFTYTPHHGNAPLNVVFTSTSTGIVDTLSWDFGDGNSGDGSPASHIFTTGVYTVTLTATNDGGSTTKTGVVSVTPPAPVANFEATSSTTGAKPFAVQFADVSVYDGTIITWRWDFDGDGTYDSSEQNPLYVYTSAGTYNVYLLVDTLSGNSEKWRMGYITVLDSPEVCPEPTVCPTVEPTVSPTPTECPVIIPEEGIMPNNIGIFRPDTGMWYLDSDGNRLYDISFRYGGSTDIPLAADFNGDGGTDIAIYRPSSGMWYIDINGDRTPDKTFHYGGSTDIPYAEDFNQDGKADMAIFRPATGFWYVDTNLDGTYNIAFRYGGTDDVPLFGNWH